MSMTNCDASFKTDLTTQYIPEENCDFRTSVSEPKLKSLTLQIWNKNAGRYSVTFNRIFNNVSEEFNKLLRRMEGLFPRHRGYNTSFVTPDSTFYYKQNVTAGSK
jgi:hypothetical protein